MAGVYTGVLDQMTTLLEACSLRGLLDKFTLGEVWSCLPNMDPAHRLVLIVLPFSRSVFNQAPPPGLLQHSWISVSRIVFIHKQVSVAELRVALFYISCARL